VQALGRRAEGGRALQVDMLRPARRAELSQGLAQGLIKSVARLYGVFDAGKGDLADFKQAFSHRWESAEVPLLEALDEERGIGFLLPGFADSPLLKDDGLHRHAARMGHRRRHGPATALNSACLPSRGRA
jgi:hypothetical protein